VQLLWSDQSPRRVETVHDNVLVTHGAYDVLDMLLRGMNGSEATEHRRTMEETIRLHMHVCVDAEHYTVILAKPYE